jgi:hypothetical protein
MRSSDASKAAVVACNKPESYRGGSSKRMLHARCDRLSRGCTCTRKLDGAKDAEEMARIRRVPTISQSREGGRQFATRKQQHTKRCEAARGAFPAEKPFHGQPPLPRADAGEVNAFVNRKPVPGTFEEHNLQQHKNKSDNFSGVASPE